MTARELRHKYLDFFQSKGHSAYPSGSLVPYDVTGRLDESLLFNGAGMVQFKPFFRGVAEPPNRRLTTAQKCVRTGDIEEVGDLTHLTFFEMLGNFSFGDYFKREAIAFSWEFLTNKEWLGLDPRRLAFTVFESDDEAFEAWAELLRGAGIDPETRIFRLGEETNYWPAGAFSKGPPGPCGPNSEMFYWVDSESLPPDHYTREDYLRDEEAKLWLEIWNDVFIQFEWQGELRNPERPNLGYEKTGMPELPFRSIDTGMGLERTAAVLGGHQSVYDTDVFEPILAKIGQISGVAYGFSETTDKAIRVIADHIRTACFCIADGILPSNGGRGYVLRRLVRRAVLKGQRVLGIERPFFHEVFGGVLASMGDHYGELKERREVIEETLRNEEALFRRTVDKGIQHLSSSIVRRWIVFRTKMANEVEGRQFVNEEAGRRVIDLYRRVSSDTNLGESVDSFPLMAASGLVRNHDLGASPAPSLEQIRGDIHKVLSVLRDSVEDYQPSSFWMGHLTVDGDEAFFLYDSLGFPLEVTKEVCAEAGFTVDEAGYEAAMKEAQERSRGAGGMDSVYSGVEVRYAFPVTPTVFVGYEFSQSESMIVGALPELDEEGRWTGRVAVALDQTPFYAESGGQVGDEGTIQGETFDLKVLDIVRQEGVYVHLCEILRLDHPTALSGMPAEEANLLVQRRIFNQPILARIEVSDRRATMRHHTATHLLHAALRSVLGSHVTQAGSLVSPEHLRFDFTHGKAIGAEELAEIERIVNNEILRNTGVITYVDLPVAEAKARGAMALFGEKYGDFVRMVEIGEFSRELCGGTHVGATGEIGMFKILSESSAASGVRRIEAVAGEATMRWVSDQLETLRQASALLKTNPKELVPAVEKTIDQLKEERRKREQLASQGAGSAEAEILTIGPVELAIQKLTVGEPKDAQLVADRLADQKPNRVVLVGLASEGKVSFVAKVGADALAQKAHAGNLLREVAKVAGGGGGGKAEFATAGGRDADKIDAALAQAKTTLAEMVNG